MPTPDSDAATRNVAAGPMSNSDQSASWSRRHKLLSEALGIVRKPQRALPLLLAVMGDGLRSRTQSTNLYSYVTTSVSTEVALPRVIDWITRAQKPDGGIPAYYSLLTGYSEILSGSHGIHRSDVV